MSSRRQRLRHIKEFSHTAVLISGSFKHGRRKTKIGVDCRMIGMIFGWMKKKNRGNSRKNSRIHSSTGLRFNKQPANRAHGI